MHHYNQHYLYILKNDQMYLHYIYKNFRSGVGENNTNIKKN